MIALWLTTGFLIWTVLVFAVGLRIGGNIGVRRSFDAVNEMMDKHPLFKKDVMSTKL